jgi:regulation of enolase protein 1 (concanavalin A-like superfamily)
MATEVTVKAEPQANYEQAGMIWHADDANYVKVVLERFEGKLVANFVREEADQPKIIAMAPAESGSVSLRLIFRDGKYEAQSRSGETKDWVMIGTCEPLPKPPVQVGLGTMQGPKEEARWVRFADFKITQP